ncbi:tetratricopeptide repeat protein [Roseateles oligotrophus]|uniref:Tetratricopeptide repeat protein n=1 Tax=Roseateles oligotrophus TaxID=1769250 RepID=A0ABT2YFQ5_9BURK|nr:tetratricopeptide repeat protein [Roseateles oligotrophus]MCV2368844.1 tetratricopeptide repeat protein [Roseateles oligotrophus]
MKSWIHSLTGLVLCLLLSACATAPMPAAPVQLFHDALFKPSAEDFSAERVFAFSPAMQDYLDIGMRTQLRSKGSRQGLLDALYNKSSLQLEYDASYTRDASQAFADRRGNCLSLVIMTAAFAKQLGLPVRYQSVYVDEVWSRTGDLYFLTGHVNLSLGRSLSESRETLADGSMLTIDFLRQEPGSRQRNQVIEEHTIVAMFMNNRAAENLQAGHIDEAYWWTRAALTADPKLLAAYNTLGVVYRRHGDLVLAEAPLRHVLAQEPANTQAMSNLVLLLKDLGRPGESAQVAQVLAQLQPYPPYKFFDMGLEAMRAGEFQKAKDLFSKEIERSAYFHEFHFWLGLANYGLGDLAGARKQLSLAVENSPTQGDRQLYTSKLDLLKVRRSPLDHMR